MSIVALQVFLIILKQRKYYTNVCENKCSLIMVLFPPAWLTATHLFGFLLVWRNLGEIFNNCHSKELQWNDLQLNLFISRGCFLSAYKLFIIRFSIFSVSHSCNHFLLSYILFFLMIIVLVLTDWPINHEWFTFHEWFYG